VHPPLRGSTALRARPEESVLPLPRSPKRARPTGSSKTKPTSPHNAPLSAAEKRTYLGYAFLVLLVVFAYLARMAYLTGLGYETSHLEREAASLQQEVEFLTAEVDRLKSPERLREVAKGLGLEKHAMVVRNDGAPLAAAPTSPSTKIVNQGEDPEAMHPGMQP